MMQWDRLTLGRMAKELGFVRDTPRLSVDIDLDYCRSIDREEMLADRDVITCILQCNRIRTASKKI